MFVKCQYLIRYREKSDFFMFEVIWIISLILFNFIVLFIPTFAKILKWINGVNKNDYC